MATHASARRQAAVAATNRIAHCCSGSESYQAVSASDHFAARKLSGTRRCLCSKKNCAAVLHSKLHCHARHKTSRPACGFFFLTSVRKPGGACCCAMLPHLAAESAMPALPLLRWRIAPALHRRPAKEAAASTDSRPGTVTPYSHLPWVTRTRPGPSRGGPCTSCRWLGWRR